VLLLPPFADVLVESSGAVAGQPAIARLTAKNSGMGSRSGRGEDDEEGIVNAPEVVALSGMMDAACWPLGWVSAYP
jgi:hypothetical protein